MDPTLLQHLNLENGVHENVLDLIKEGLLEYALDEQTGELVLMLTPEGEKACEEF